MEEKFEQLEVKNEISDEKIKSLIYTIRGK